MQIVSQGDNLQICATLFFGGGGGGDKKNISSLSFDDLMVSGCGRELNAHFSSAQIILSFTLYRLRRARSP